MAGQNWGAGRPWEQCGGSAPYFGALTAEQVGGGVALPIALGTNPYQVSTFTQTGLMCDATARIELGTSPTAGTGFWTLEGLPAAPRIVGTPNHGGNKIGSGWFFSGATKKQWAVHVVADHGSLGTGIFFFPLYAVDESGNLVQSDFAFGGKEQICHDSHPFAPVAGDIMNITLRFEAATS